MEKEGGEELKQLNQRFTSLENAARIQKDPEFGYHSQIVKDADSVKCAKEAICFEVMFPTDDTGLF